MIAYEELVVALTNWRIQQGLETTALEFSQPSGRVDLDLPVASVDVEEIVDMDASDLDEVLDASSIESELPAGEILYDDGEHTSIAEPGSFPDAVAPSDENMEALDYGNDDTQYQEPPVSEDVVEAQQDEASVLVEEVVEADDVAVEESIEVADQFAATTEEAEIQQAEAGELHVEAHQTEELVEQEVDAAGLEVEELVEQEVDAAGLEVEELVEQEVDAAGLEVEEVDLDINPSATGDFGEDESTMMGMGASLANLAPGTATTADVPKLVPDSSSDGED
ncbi:MAG: hypothetical protein JKY56_15820 [Kofleriaceae bacterium]|nr:hypothetical protein [Kofleriaceae bacterium]